MIPFHGIVDRNKRDNAWIHVESRPVGSDSDSRPSDVAYRKENETFFDRYSSEYDVLLNNSELHECNSTSPV